MSKFKNIKADLKAILEHSEIHRNNNVELYYYYCVKYLGIETNTPFYSICCKIHSKQIPSMDTVSRLSRQIQQQNPHLRGKNWDKKHRQQEEVINDLKNND